MPKLTFVYEVSDGSMGKTPPQTFTVYSDDFDPEMSDGEIFDEIEASMQDHFEKQIHPELLEDEQEAIDSVREAMKNEDFD